MFEHVTILLSFVFAIALTHLLSSATELILARDRVRFSGLYAVWVVNALLLLLGNWLAVWGLVAVKHWTVSEVALQFTSAIVEYFTCSTLSIRPGETETIDVPVLYETRRTVIFLSFLALGLIALFENYWDRNNLEGFSPTTWIGEDLSILPMIATVLVAGWARPLWLQWTAALAMVGLNVVFLSVYTLPA